MRTGILTLTDRIAGLLTTPLLPNDYLRYVNPLWSTREMRGRIVSVTPLTDDSALLRIEAGHGFDFAYRPGQYVGIGVLVAGRWRWRSYSILPVPDADGTRKRNGHIAIGVKAKPGGAISGHLVTEASPGSIVRLATPTGDFFLPDPAPDRLLFLSAGSGITPVMALLRDLVARGGLTDVVHIHSAPTQADVMFGSDLLALRESHPGYRLHIQQTARDGRFDLNQLPLVCADWTERSAYVCGAAGFVADVEKHWSTNDLTESLRAERFELQRNRTGNGGTVTFGRNGRAIEVDGATTILEASEKAGVSLPHGCRIGICRTCVLPLEEGSVTDIRTGESHEAGTRIQTCVSTPSENCTITT